VIDKILFGTGISHHGADDPTRRYLEIGDQRLRPVADVFKLLRFRLTSLHRPGGVSPFQRLDAGLLVGADHMYPLLMEFHGLVIQLAHCPHLLPELGFIRHVIVQPMADPVGL
jgi:hypothetical protein